MRRLLAVVIVVAVAALGGVACGTGTPPDPGDDPVLQLGRQVYADRCARCHGASGGGGAGPALRGDRLEQRFPDPADQAVIVRDGRGAMPAWGGVLSDEEIDAVVAYTRQVL